MKKEYEIAILAALLILPFAVYLSSQSMIAGHHYIPESGIDFYCDFGPPQDCLIYLGWKSDTMVILVQYLEGQSQTNAQMIQAFTDLVLTYGSTGRDIEVQFDTPSTCTVVNISDPSDVGTTLNGSCSHSSSEKNPLIAIAFPSAQRAKSEVYITKKEISIQPRTWEHMLKIVTEIRMIVAPDVFERMGDLSGAFNNSS